MVIDDDPILGKLISKLLKNHTNYDVKYYSNVDKAMKRIKKQKIDAVLLDWMMPGVSGIEVLMNLKGDAATKDIPVFMLTQRKTGSDFEKACAFGVDGYFTKPADPMYIKNRLMGFLNA